MTRRILTGNMTAALLAVSAIVGCQQAPEKEESGPINVVATTGMVADLVREVGRDRVKVTQLLGPGVDPHLYSPVRDDVSTIMGADIVMYSGLMLEGKMTDILVKVGRDKPVWAVTESIEKEYLLEPDDAEGHFDPHLWNDVQAWGRCVDVVYQALSKQDPDGDQEFRANASAYQQQLTKLHEYGVKSLGTIPKENRVLVTSHDAFNYFGRAYDLEVMGVQGLSTESEAGLQRINELVDTLVEKNVQAVFVESSVPRKSIEALVDGAESRGHKVKIGGELFSDAMGELNTYEGTYIGMMDHNISLVALGLGGEVPEKGYNGKLNLDQAADE